MKGKRRIVPCPRGLVILLLLNCGILSAEPAKPAKPAESDNPQKFGTYVGVDGGFNYMLNGLDIYDNLLGSTNFWHVGLSYGVQTRPTGNYYNRIFNYPEYGLKFMYSSTGSMEFKNNSCLGDLFTLQGFFKPNFYRGNVFSVGAVINVGATYTPKPWDPVTNVYNYYVGSHIIVYIGVGLEARVQISPRWSIAAQAGLSHRSNGMLRVPNLGLNNIETSIQLRYNIDESPVFKREAPLEAEPFKKLNYDIYLTGGVHACDAERNIIKDTTGEDVLVESYLRLNLGGLFSYRYHPLLATGVGADIFYTGNWKRLEECSRMLGGNDECCPVYAGVYLQQSLYYKNWEFGVGVGVYVFKQLGPEDSGWDYERVLLRYHFPKTGLIAGFAMRAHSFDRSDTLEFTFGKRF